MIDRNDSLTPRRVRALIALGWLLAGAAVLTLTPMPLHSESLGWTPTFWLVLAPASLLLALRRRA
ncbi:hypothetical protein FHW69_001241 [Luteibacter sp. Sphag1AF]|uniref:hypothetical protein n=1 Tax=Luteibacter sp. Sphag1AF TaxID=2587031 RepID=UPI0016201340|nr:hypothetical protein [Luteibacter sp. Sphag1AF]MBB3226651.1 hypothetical protein [Luteibacter sp. Sphag1AF]